MKTLTAAQPGWYVVPVVYESLPTRSGDWSAETVDKEALPYAYPVAFWVAKDDAAVKAGFTKDGELREVATKEVVLLEDFKEAGGHKQPSVHWKIMHRTELPHNVKAI